MGLEELALAPILVGAFETAAEVAPEALAFATPELAAEAAAAAIPVGAFETAAELGSAAVGESVAAAVPVAATDIADVLAAQGIVEIPGLAAEAVAAPLPFAPEAIATISAPEVLRDAAALTGAEIITVGGEELAAGLTGAEALSGILTALDQILPGSKTLLSAVAEGKLNIPAMLQVLAATLRLLGPLGPGIAQLLKLHNVTANKHIPAALASLQVLFGKVITAPTTKDQGIILDVSQVKTALGSLGVRFSPEEDFPDVLMVAPIGNVLDDGLTRTSDEIREQMRAQSAQQREDAANAEQRAGDLAERMTEAIAQSGTANVEAAKTQLEALQAFLEGLVAGLSEVITKGVFPPVELLLQLLGPVLVPLVTLFAETAVKAVKIAHEPVAQALEKPFREQLTNFTSQFLGSEGVRPDQAIERATVMFGQALKFGTFAHALALVGELVHPTKELGLPQLAAALADFGAFAPIAANTVGIEARAAIGRPMQYQANRITRSQLPDLRAVTEMFLERRIDLATFKERLAFEGWRDEWIEAYLTPAGDPDEAVPYREPTARELGVIFEDVTVDEAWIMAMLRQGGYSDRDADQVLKGVRMRGQKSVRMGLLSEAQGAFEEGTLSADGLDQVLETLGLRDESRRLVHQRGALGRARHVTKLLAQQYETLAKGQVIGLEDYRVALAGLGMQDEVVAAEVAVVDALLRGQVAKDERAEIKTEVRKEQALAVEIAEKQVRLGTLSVPEAQAILEQYGIHENQARLMAMLAGLKTLPVPKLPEVLSVEAAQQKIQEFEVDAILSLVGRGVMEGPIGLAVLLGLGVGLQEATARIALAVARATKAPKLPEPTKESPEVREARRIRTQEAVAAFRAGDSSEGELRARLSAAGNTEAIVDAMVSREVTLARIAAERELERLATQIQRDLLRAAAKVQVSGAETT